LNQSVAEFERVIRTNLTGSFIVAREAGRVMKISPPMRAATDPLSSSLHLTVFIR